MLVNLPLTSLLVVARTPTRHIAPAKSEVVSRETFSVLVSKVIMKT